MTTRLEKLESMLATDPSDQMLRYMLAMELDKHGDHARSLELFTSLMSDAPAHVPAFLMAGQQLARLDRTEEARTTYQAGIQQAREQGDEHAAGEMSQFLQEL